MQRFVSIDSETALILSGNLAPPLVCLSIAERNSQTNEVATDLLLRDDAIARYHVLLRDPSVHIVIHNAAFDLGVAANEDQSLLPLIFDAYREGRIHCTIALQKLIDVAAGMRKFRRKDGVITKASYTLQSLVEWYYQEQLEKEETWRLSYALLKDVPLTRWPADAKKYAIYDAIWHLKTFEAQQKYIKDRFGELPNQIDTQRAAWVLHLIGMQGVRADKPAVDHFIKTCEIEINKMHNDLYNLCIKCGFDQENHNTSNCSSFENTNIFRKDKKGKFVRNMSEIRRRVEASFAAMQLDVPKTDPSKKFLEGQTRTDRETLEATNDPNLHILAASMTFQKHLDQWGPVCSAAILRPVCARYDVMMETGRTSCSGSEGQEGTNFQNPPRKGDVRPCFIPRSGYVFCSTDADTIELRALAQCLLELIGWSKMADALLDQHKNKGPDLHLRLAASLMGIDPYEGLRRKNEGDVEIGEGRQTVKCFNFGYPGGLGAETMISYAAALLDKNTHQKWFGVTYEEQLIKARFYRETWFNTWPEMRLFFRRVQDMIQKNGGTIRQLQSDRIRGDCRFTAACNTFFQGRVADAMKEILFMLSEEAFTGRCVSKHVHGGSNICTVYGRSILWGSRISMFLHDEPIMEHPLNDRPSLRATRQQQLMVAGLSNWMKDIPCTSTPVLMHRWYKGAEPVFIDGELVPSKPLKIDGKVKWIADV